ncbi:Branched-chain amino acid dehydrogenase [deaminating] [hydrothermal vent metagenome]|uniref:Branched-chain amino acid dehydrogenase [deaminating] n=1 Tax=hydrothermal vent metagenome TaxID=652676 RepID=A0A3B1DCE6_9ZZZZ
MTNIFEQIQVEGHEQVLICSDPASGLRALIAIHNTTLGPALGGCRMWPYDSFDDALSDVLRLSRAMSYKAAVSDLPLGGGKSVIWGDADKEKTPALLEAFAKQVESLAGRYIVAEDVGITVDDIETMRCITPHVAGHALAHGGSGDPSPATAHGVFSGMRACLEEVYGDASFKGKRVAIQGLGKVGSALAKLLHEAGATLYVSDMDPERVAHAIRDYGADPIHGHEVYRVDCDVFSPCALGGIINERSIESLSCKIIAGAANNQLKTLDVADELKNRNILYAPDYVLNAGGLINIAQELKGYGQEQAYEKISKIYDRMKGVFILAKKESISTAAAAERLAELRLYAKSTDV